MRFWGAELQFPEGTIDLRQRSGRDETGRAGLMRAGAGAAAAGRLVVVCAAQGGKIEHARRGRSAGGL